MEREQIIEAFQKKLDECWNNYMYTLGRYSKESLIKMSEEITATRFLYNELHGGGYPEDYMEYLMRFANPLEVVRDQWLSERNIDFSEELNHALWFLFDKGDAEQFYALDLGYTPIDETNKIVTVREFIERHPCTNLEIMSPGGYVCLTPEKAQMLLSCQSIMGNAGHPDYALEVTADEILNQKVSDANFSDGTWYMLSVCIQEAEQNQNSFEQGVTMC